MRAGPALRRPPRALVIAVSVGGALLVAALLGGRPGRDGPPLDPRSDGPLGTSALVSLLEGLDANVVLTPGVPAVDDDVALVLQDRLDEAQTASLHDWVRRGGTLVVTDPASNLTPVVVEQGFVPDSGTIEPGRCTIPALDQVSRIDGGAAVRFEPAEADGICFGDRQDGAFVVQTAVGGGQVVAVGGAAFLTNDLLGHDANAVLAAALLAPVAGTQVRVVEPPVPAGGGDKSLRDLVPGGVQRALAQLGVAFVLYAVWRAIRLGQPVPEEQPVAIAGSELVSAVGRLLSRARAPGAAAHTVREGARRALRARLGVPPEVPTSELAAIGAARLGLPLDDVLTAVDDRPVTTDAELVAVARAVASIHQEVPS